MPKTKRPTKRDRDAADYLAGLIARVAVLEADLHQALTQNKDLYADREAWRHRAMSAYDALSETRQMLDRERATHEAKRA